jgi:hypothetical protein
MTDPIRETTDVAHLLRRASDPMQPPEIARLRAALRSIAEGGPPAEYERIAREALAE